VHWLQRSLLQ